MDEFGHACGFLLVVVFGKGVGVLLGELGDSVHELQVLLNLLSELVQVECLCPKQQVLVELDVAFVPPGFEHEVYAVLVFHFYLFK